MTNRTHRRGYRRHNENTAVVSTGVARGEPITFVHFLTGDFICFGDDVEWFTTVDGVPAPAIHTLTPDQTAVICLHCLDQLHPANRAALAHAREHGVWNAHDDRG
jgi:hypothetical protein